MTSFLQKRNHHNLKIECDWHFMFIHVGIIKQISLQRGEFLGFDIPRDFQWSERRFLKGSHGERQDVKRRSFCLCEMGLR